MRTLDVIVSVLAIIAASCMILTGIFGVYNAAHTGVAKLHWTDTNKFHHWSSERSPYFASAEHATLLM